MCISVYIFHILSYHTLYYACKTSSIYVIKIKSIPKNTIIKETHTSVLGDLLFMLKIHNHLVVTVNNIFDLLIFGDDLD